MKLTRFNNCKLDDDAKEEHYKVESVQQEKKDFYLPQDYRRPVVFTLGVQEMDYDD